MIGIKRCLLDTYHEFYDLQVVDVEAHDDCVCLYLYDSTVLEVPTKCIKRLEFVPDKECDYCEKENVS